MEVTKRMERRHYKEIRNNRRRREDVVKKVQAWKEKTSDEVNCHEDQLEEFTGKIYRDDCVFALDRNKYRIFLHGTVDRVPDTLMPEALVLRDELRVIDEQLMTKLEGYADIYDTFTDLINISTGQIYEHTTVKADESKSESKEPSA